MYIDTALIRADPFGDAGFSSGHPERLPHITVSLARQRTGARQQITHTFNS